MFGVMSADIDKRKGCAPQDTGDWGLRGLGGLGVESGARTCAHVLYHRYSIDTRVCTRYSSVLDDTCRPHRFLSLP